jgi:UDP-GlcNAc:undecaprenyl-phosphate GlcNAc-1-phosphate transferase
MDHPDVRKPHERPTARTGGLALGLVCGVLFLMHRGPFAFSTLDTIGCLGLSILGFIDDRRSLRPRPKAILGLTFAAILAFGVATDLHARMPLVTLLGLELSTEPAVTFLPLLLWFWSIPQAFNLSDGLNGLALGLFGLAMALVGGVGLGQSPAFWGAWTAVLLLNFPRARHFLGDCGSLGMGAAISILMIRWASSHDAGFALWVAAYWVADVTAVVLIRQANGRPLGEGDLNHLHHRMLELAGRKVVIATPLLLLMGGLPMLKAIPHPAAQTGSFFGLILLITFAVVHVAQAVREPIRARASKVPDPESGAYPVESAEL